LSFTLRPANSFIVVVPTIQAPMPNESAVDSNSLPESVRPGSGPQRLERILPSIVVHM
jgi:hypothetical protein